MARRGRARKTGPRENNGRPQRHGRDRGTKVTQSLRQWYAGSGDPLLTGYPLGILFANQALTDHEHAVACNYAWLHSTVFGRHTLAAVSWDMTAHGRDPGSDIEDEDKKQKLEAAERKLEDIIELFRTMPRRCRAGLDNIAIYERTPRWMRPVDPRQGDVADARYFREAIKVLCRWSLGEKTD